jgi:hypothetical protein
MITESEKNALQLAKRVFEHFTHDSLPIAREIIAMELELGNRPVNGEPVNGATNPIPQVKKTRVNDFPVSDISTNGIVDDDPAQPVKKLKGELVCQQEDDLPF